MLDNWQQPDQLNALQPLENHRFHRWYRFVLAYSDKLVTDLIGRYGIDEDSLLLDPFSLGTSRLSKQSSLTTSSLGIRPSHSPPRSCESDPTRLVSRD